MDNQDLSFFAYIKYEGKLVENGYMDARKSADALLGIDEVLRYFIYDIDPALEEYEFNIPVRVAKGSWEALLPNDLQEWVRAAAGAGLLTYMTTAAKKMAENDVGENGFKDIVRAAIKGMKWVIQIAKHLGAFRIKDYGNLQYKQNNDLIGIPNQNSEYLFVPKKYLEIYQKCPDKLFNDLTKIIELERELEIGFSPNEPIDNDDTDRAVKISNAEKYLFTKEDKETQFLFPDLEHGKIVELEGHVTRGNENANSIGFEYLRHILTCYPASGNVKDYKNLLFTNCKIKGTVDRTDDNGVIAERRPKIIFHSLEEIPTSGGQLGLFL